MPRIARVVAIDLPHHITQRGNYQQRVFLDDRDRTQYLSWIQEYSVKYSLSLLVHCLMDNHIHFIAIPHKEDSLARAFNTAHMRYSQYFNKKMKTKGHLWQGRFYSCVLDEPHLITAARYIERNPVRAKIVNKPWQWKWSSAQTHINEGQAAVKPDNLFESIDMARGSWKEYIDSKEDEKTVKAIRAHTLTGRPLGSKAFIEKLEKRFSRRLIALPRGRPWRRQK
ncbi:MAG: transposase [Candidatus Omnitrophica bacterium CG12_big_fil_rev_8_21_14_0_65_42_8]|nr:MAG: transposase [Candidatus Omnitrophica bacterium CG12_big_fil_rev_8_21_14_0_65_42_8]